MEHDLAGDKILLIFKKILSNVDFHHALHERYIHHYFSHHYQKFLDSKATIIDIINPEDSHFQLHPEWPTYKQSTGINYSLYKRKVDQKLKGNSKYEIVDLSSVKNDNFRRAAHVDFAIGNYKKPYFGVEFKTCFGYPKYGISFDLLKLMDNRNPFKFGFSFNIILRKNKATRKKASKNLLKAMCDSYQIAQNEIDKTERSSKNEKKILFIVLELDSKSKKLHYSYFDSYHKQNKNCLNILTAHNICEWIDNFSL